MGDRRACSIWLTCTNLARGKEGLSQALYWYRKAAEAGDSGGMSKTGAMYEKGLGVEKDHAQAVFWYRKAAEFGDRNAKANLKRLGVMQ
jgi:TPR repeat protein